MHVCIVNNWVFVCIWFTWFADRRPLSVNQTWCSSDSTPIDYYIQMESVGYTRVPLLATTHLLRFLLASQSYCGQHTSATANTLLCRVSLQWIPIIIIITVAVFFFLLLPVVWVSNRFNSFKIITSRRWFHSSRLVQSLEAIVCLCKWQASRFFRPRLFANWLEACTHAHVPVSLLFDRHGRLCACACVWSFKTRTAVCGLVLVLRLYVDVDWLFFFFHSCED